MTRLAVIGANGQVGAELCLMLAELPDIELVAVCRNRSGSAFLRWQGIACRHGRIADPDDAARLIGDCDVILNSSLAAGAPAEIRRTEDRIVDHIIAYSPDRARVIHFSTQSVYGDPTRGAWIRWRNPYGRAKLATEHRLVARSRRAGKDAYVLRLGHVCGSLQEISLTIRDSIRDGDAVLPFTDHPSNTVYTAAIVGAIRQVVNGGVAPGTYDLMNTPSWTWRQVYEYEAQLIGAALPAFRVGADPSPASPGRAVLSLLRWLSSQVLAARWIVDTGTKLFAYAPGRMNGRAMAWWFARRARAEVAALNSSESPPEHLSWVRNGVNFFPADVPTRALLDELPVAPGSHHQRQPWPADLPDASI